MVARLIHRYGVTDRPFPEARAGRLGDVRDGDTAMFGLTAVEHGAPVVASDWAASGRSIRDAARLEKQRGQAGNQRDDLLVASRLIDLGDLRVDASDAPSVVTHATADIAGRGGVPCLLAGGIREAGAVIRGVANGSAQQSGPVILVAPGFELTRHLHDAAVQHPLLAIGSHDIVSASSYRSWKERGGDVMSAYALTTGGQDAVDAALAALGSRETPAIVVLDMDCVDTGYAGGTWCTNVGGMDPIEFSMVVERVGAWFRIAGVAVVNLAPERDPRGHSERMAAMALLGLGCSAAASGE